MKCPIPSPIHCLNFNTARFEGNFSEHVSWRTALSQQRYLNLLQSYLGSLISSCSAGARWMEHFPTLHWCPQFASLIFRPWGHSAVVLIDWSVKGGGHGDKLALHARPENRNKKNVSEQAAIYEIKSEKVRGLTQPWIMSKHKVWCS